MKSESWAPSPLQRLGGALIDPEATFKAMDEADVGVSGALIAVIVISLVMGLLTATVVFSVFRMAAGALQWFGIAGGFQPAWFSWLTAFIIPGLTAVFIISSLFYWVLSGAITHVTAKYVFAGEGSYSRLLTFYGYGWSAWMPFMAGLSITALTDNPLFVAVLLLVSLMWLLISWTSAVKVCYGLDMGRAFLCSFVTPLTVYVIIMLVLFHGFMGG